MGDRLFIDADVATLLGVSIDHIRKMDVGELIRRGIDKGLRPTIHVSKAKRGEGALSIRVDRRPLPGEGR